MKVTRSQIREIIREHQAEAEAEYLLNEGFLDFMKKLGKAAMAAFGKAKEVTTEFKKALDKQMESQSPEMKKKIAAVAEGYEGQTEKMKQDFLKKIMSDMDSNLPDMEKTEKQKYALSILNYAWAAAGSKGG